MAGATSVRETFPKSYAVDLTASHPILDYIYQGDCREILPFFASESIDLIVTSPPYADQRKHSYGGIHPDAYVEWFLPIADELHRVLKPTGSFVLNIKERTVNGERHTYVIELILAMRKRGWLWTEEYCWHKKNCYPGKWPNRFRDAWERCLHFTKSREFAMYQEAVMVPVGDWAAERLRVLSETDKRRDESKADSGFGKRVANWIGRDKVYPTNVLYFATECANKAHSAVFPLALPTWFINLFTVDGDTVLDPFIGSGTTAVAARNLGRHYVVAIKSGPNWGNSSHIDIIEPIGFQAKRHNMDFEERKDAIANQLIAEFMTRFCTQDYAIDWAKLVAFNSGNLGA